MMANGTDMELPDTGATMSVEGLLRGILRANQKRVIVSGIRLEFESETSAGLPERGGAWRGILDTLVGVVLHGTSLGGSLSFRLMQAEGCLEMSVCHTRVGGEGDGLAAASLRLCQGAIARCRGRLEVHEISRWARSLRLRIPLGPAQPRARRPGPGLWAALWWGGLVLLLLMAMSFPAFAAFQEQFQSARTASMGGSGAVFADEAASLFQNPSGLAGLGAYEVSFLYNKPYAGLQTGSELSTGFIAAAAPTALGTLGLGVGTFMASGLKQERTMALSWGRRFGWDGKSPVSGFDLGVTGKHLWHSYAPADVRDARDPVFAKGASRSAVGFDMAVGLRLGDFWRAGVTILNVNRPDVGLAAEDRVPRQVEAGLGVDLPGAGLRAMGHMLMRDYAFGEASGRYVPGVGLEKSFRDSSASFRLGANINELTGGLGLKLKTFRFDYALAISRSLASDSLGTHRLGVTLQFGSSRGKGPEGKSRPDFLGGWQVVQ